MPRVPMSMRSAGLMARALPMASTTQEVAPRVPQPWRYRRWRFQLGLSQPPVHVPAPMPQRQPLRLSRPLGAQALPLVGGQRPQVVG